MVILHIAAIRNNPFNGVCVAAPEHIRHQSQIAEVALLNINDCQIEGVEKQFVYHKRDWKDDVTEQFRRPDIVVFHEVYHIEFAKIAKSLDFDDIPYVIIPHGGLVNEAQKKKRLKKILANFFFFNKFIYHSAIIQCLSQNELDNIRFKVPKFIGSNGVNIPVCSKTSFGDKELTITYIGRLEVLTKGIDLFVKAVSQIKSFLIANNVRLFIYGPDIFGRYAAVEELIKNNDVADILSLNHELVGKDKENKLLTSDYFVQTSRHEGMPMGILEAMSYGLPCIITEGTSLGELTRRYDAGWVAQNTVASIADTIMEAVNQKGALCQKSKNAMALVLDNFSWEIVSNTAIEKYKQFFPKNEIRYHHTLRCS